MNFQKSYNHLYIVAPNLIILRYIDLFRKCIRNCCTYSVDNCFYVVFLKKIEAQICLKIKTNSLRTLEAQVVIKIKSNKPQPIFTCLFQETFTVCGKQDC